MLDVVCISLSLLYTCNLQKNALKNSLIVKHLESNKYKSFLKAINSIEVFTVFVIFFISLKNNQSHIRP